MATGNFFNVITNTFSSDAVEYKPRYRAYYIRLGFCGFNTAANNSKGYATQAKAEAAIMRLQNKAAGTIAQMAELGRK